MNYPVQQEKTKIPVTKPFLPPKEEYEAYLKRIWESEWLTNDGPMVRELEQRLKEYLDVNHLLYLGNGTIALQIAIKALDLKGEIITTPFSYVATTSSIIWENCTAVFADIDPDSLNIDPVLIESKITEETTAILATHVFGNPCDLEAIDEIAQTYNLKVIYDAAHAFGTTYKGESIFNWGDISTTSFHATKVFQTVEGGAVFTESLELYEKMRLLRNFGHDGRGVFNGVGINGKNSEMHAAMGLCNLKYIDEVLSVRKKQVHFYNKLLNGERILKPRLLPESEVNLAYYPAIFENETATLAVRDKLEMAGISPRRYFYPSLNEIEYTGAQSAPVSEGISARILCLPLYHELKEEQQEKIASIIHHVLNGK